MNIFLIIIFVILFVVVLFGFYKLFSGEKVAQAQETVEEQFGILKVNTVYARLSNYLDFADDSNIHDPIEVKKGRFYILTNKDNYHKTISKLSSAVKSDFWGRKYFIGMVGEKKALEMDDFLEDHFEEFKNAEIDKK